MILNYLRRANERSAVARSTMSSVASASQLPFKYVRQSTNSSSYSSFHTNSAATPTRRETHSRVKLDSGLRMRLPKFSFGILPNACSISLTSRTNKIAFHCNDGGSVGSEDGIQGLEVAKRRASLITLCLLQRPRLTIIFHSQSVLIMEDIQRKRGNYLLIGKPVRSRSHGTASANISLARWRCQWTSCAVHHR
jgi:hypothetical protein